MKVIDRLMAQVEALQAQLKPTKKLKYYTYKQAAEMLCITVEGLKTRIKRGQMVRVTNNNRPLIAHTEIERFLKEQNPDGIGAFFKIFLNYFAKCKNALKFMAYLFAFEFNITTE